MRCSHVYRTGEESTYIQKCEKETDNCTIRQKKPGWVEIQQQELVPGSGAGKSIRTPVSQSTGQDIVLGQRLGAPTKKRWSTASGNH